MDDKLSTKLFNSAATIFEQLCFMFTTPELEEKHRNAKVDATASVGFRGPFCGRLVISVYGGLLSTMASNMLGVEEPLSLEQQHDALGEIANVICGNVLPAIAGFREVFNFSAPQIAKEPAPVGGDSESPVAKAHLILEQGRAELLLIVDGEPSPYLKEQNK